MFEIGFWLIVVTFVVAEIFQWVEIYDDGKSLKYMFKEFMWVWGLLFLIEAVLLLVYCGFYHIFQLLGL